MLPPIFFTMTANEGWILPNFHAGRTGMKIGLKVFF